jgi:dihydroxyacid dehydratase/phosphogluconate dehydratase
MSIDTIFTPQDEQFYAVKTHAAGPQGALPLTPQMLLESPSGNLFGMTQNAGMGWDANKLTGREVLLIGTQGGIRHSDGRPIALGYHTGHWEIGLQMSAAAKEITRLSGIPFAAFVSDPCDGRSRAPTACSTPCRTVTTRPSFSPPDPLAADAPGGDRRRHLR